ncbi:HK97 family phage portal protein [Peptoniphilus olsenii]|uniref:HK97 family phage portal protein n=1 Tax=Peptoniphilus olsenii TaxID=411570 RepID=A0ABV2J7I1_9FIRM
MGIIKSIKNYFEWGTPNEDWEFINVSNGGGYKNNIVADTEITYFICLKVLSESLGKLSIHLKDGHGVKITDSDINYLLKVRPNPYMSPSDFKILMELNRNHYGNAYALIETKGGKRVALHPLDPSKVKILIDDAKILKSDATYIYKYKAKNKTYYFKDKEIIHLKGGLSRDGIVGKSIAEELASTIKGAKESQKYLNDLYARGLTANAILEYTGELNKAKKTELVRTITDFVRDKDNGNIVPIPLGMKLTPLDIKLTDAQFFDLKKFTSLQIAAAFGIKPNHLNNYDKSSYNNSEMQNLTFLIDTLLVILKKYEEEFDYKLLFDAELKSGVHTEFNVATILRGDLKSQAEALQKYVSGGIYTPNEARNYSGMPFIDGGDVLMVNGTFVPIEDIGKAYEKGGEKD